ncbi:MAG: preprotein translocase subunit SecE [Mycoplasma sp.]|nr:preprotein translocase subunit SecE [Candidatus Hennigella equi]
MTDINTNKSTSTTNDSKSKKELKQEQRNKQYKIKLEENRLAKIAKLEKKKAKLSIKFNKAQNPKVKSRIQDKMDKITKELADLNDPAKAVVKRPFGLVMKTWSKGLNKETGRVAWYKKNEGIKDFVTIILVCVFLGVIFFAIDMIIVAIR